MIVSMLHTGAAKNSTGMGINNMKYSGLIAYFALALVVSFLCSLMESVILSVRPVYIETLETKRPRAAALLKKLKENIERPLSAILTLNTVANTVGAAGVGAEALRLFGSAYVAVTSGILTLSILVLSEIIPKTLGTAYWKKLAPLAAYVILFFIAILYPLVRILEAISGAVSHHKGKYHFSREEVLAAARLGHSQGTLRSQENMVIQNLLSLQNIRVKDILTPRSVLLALQQDMTVAEVVSTHNQIRFSRIPIYGKDMDDITAFVHRYKILQAFSENKTQLKLHEMAQPIHAIPETKNVADTLYEFTKRRDQIFLVVDEYGGTAGIITLEDAIETLLGVEIVDEFDTVEDMRKFALRQGQKRRRKYQL